MSVFELALPIALSGLATHVFSVLAWMVLPHHKPEWKVLGVQDQLQDWLEEKGVVADQYVFPHTTDPAEMQTDAFKARQSKSNGMLVLWPSAPNMGANIAKTLAFFFVAAFSIGYLASLGLPYGASFGDVFRFVVVAGLLTHCAGQFPSVFWFRRRVAMDSLDGVVFAIVTALIFAFFWPAAST